ncbi:hypothetical protein MP638_005291 [Amoeboaphelidium occidentale]|nr:hypothetical protein MP638_005291 [Amoeboaphelidium occidentale]
MKTNNVETLWIKHGDGPAIEIPIQRCRSVSDLVDSAINTMKLEGSTRDFRLYANGGRIPLGSLKPLKHVVQEFNISKEKPLEAIKRPRRNVEPPFYGSMKFNARPDALEAYDSYMKCAEELQKINATSHLKGF